MKKFILMTLMSFMIFGAFAQSKTLIGRCEFYKDKNNKGPSNTVTIGGDVDLYHNGSFRQTGTEGSVNIWKGDGDIWVIYRRSDARRKYRFITSGRIQTCDNY